MWKENGEREKRKKARDCHGTKKRERDSISPSHRFALFHSFLSVVHLMSVWSQQLDNGGYKNYSIIYLVFEKDADCAQV